MFKFIIDLAVMHFLFTCLWTFLITYSLVIISSLFKMGYRGMVLAKGIGAFTFSTLSAGIVLNHQTGVISLIIFSLYAFIIIISYLSLVNVKVKRNVNQKPNFLLESMILESELNYNFIYSFIAIVSFVLTFFISSINEVSIIKVFIFLKDWILNGNYTLSIVIKVLSFIYLIFLLINLFFFVIVPNVIKIGYRYKE